MAIMMAIMGTGSISQCWYTLAWWYWLYYRIASQKYIKRIKKFALKSGIKASNKRPLSVAMLQCPLARLRAECVCVCVWMREREREQCDYFVWKSHARARSARVSSVDAFVGSWVRVFECDFFIVRALDSVRWEARTKERHSITNQVIKPRARCGT